MKNLICILTLALLIISAGSCIQKPVATETTKESSPVEDFTDIGATYRFPEDTPVQWLVPFPDMAKPVYDSLSLHNNQLYVSVRHRNAVSYLRCDIQNPSLNSPFHDWYWDYVSRDLDTYGHTPDPDYVVVNETSSTTTQEAEPFVVLVNGNKLQAISPYIDPNYGSYETRPNDPKRILWEHTLSNYFKDFCYYNHTICYLGKESDKPTQYGQAQYKDTALNVLDADTGEKTVNWYPPQDELDSYGGPLFEELRFACQYENLYIMYHKPEFPKYLGPFPIYAFDMNTHTLAWQSKTFNGGCSGGYELNGKLYFLDDQADIIEESYAYALYGIDIKTGEKSDPSFISVSGTLKGVTETQFLIRSSGCFTSVNQETMAINWTYKHITGYSKPQEGGTILLVKEDRYLQKVNISDGTTLQEWDIQTLTNSRLSLYRNVNTTKYDLSDPEELEDYYSTGKNQLVISKEGILCAIYKEKLGYYSLKEDTESTYTKPENLQFHVYGIIAIDMNKPMEISN